MNIIRTEHKRHSQELIERYRKIHPSEVGHIIEFGFMSPAIGLINGKSLYVVGSAITVRIPPCDSTMVYKAMELAEPGDILVIEVQGEKRHSCWGEMTSRAAIQQGMAGAIIDGPNCDTAEIKELGLPVFSNGRSNLTTKFQGFRGDVNVPVQCGGVVVCPGDIVLANEDGILVIPYDQAERIIVLAEQAEKKNELNVLRFSNNEHFTEFISYVNQFKKMEVIEE